MATLEACTKITTSRKRKQRIFEFKSFGKALVDFCGPFRDNIRLFLEEYGEQIVVQRKKVWSMLLLSESNGEVFPLYVVEECIGDHSVRPFCSHCKSVG